jgi:hypothetical protein
MKERGTAPAHTDIDVPLAGVMLADVNIGDRPAWRALRREFAFQK